MLAFNKFQAHAWKNMEIWGLLDLIGEMLTLFIELLPSVHQDKVWSFDINSSRAYTFNLRTECLSQCNAYVMTEILEFLLCVHLHFNAEWWQGISCKEWQTKETQTSSLIFQLITFNGYPLLWNKSQLLTLAFTSLHALSPSGHSNIFPTTIFMYLAHHQNGYIWHFPKHPYSFWGMSRLTRLAGRLLSWNLLIIFRL